MRKTMAVLAAAAWVATASAQDRSAGASSPDGVASSALWARERAREDAGDIAGAIQACMQLLHDHPTQQARAMSVIAGLNGKRGRFNEEITWAKRAIAADPQLFEAAINLGNAQVQLGQLKQGQASFERARAIAPKEPVPVYSLGVLAENRHDVPAATALYEQSVALDPAFDSGWFNLAAMYATAHRFDDALAALDKVLALNPHAEDARAMRRHVEADKAAAR
jgi:tetratricopeptide (TPR) repeat protein